jgi:ubiquinone/menaquinone biosynthesis C-methylase UbiE
MPVTADTRPLLKRYAFLAPRYDRLFAHYSDETLAEAERAVVMHAPGARDVLDVACGTGLLIERLRSRLPAARFIGVDLSPAMLNQASRKFVGDSRIALREASAEHLPFEAASFDAVTCSNAFHLIPDHERALAEFRRVLRPDGLLVILDWDRTGWTMWLVHHGYRVVGRFPRTILTGEELERLIVSAGFSAIERRRVRSSWFWRLNVVVARR